MGIIQNRSNSLSQVVKWDEIPPFPRVILLEPTSFCNLKCSFCGHSKKSQKSVMMELEKATRILGEAYFAGAREVGFYLLGEPLLHPDLPKMVAVAKTLGYSYIYITTNGVLATPKKVRELIKCGLHSLKFSINAGDRNSYHVIHGIDAFERVKENLMSCILMRRQEDAKKVKLDRLLVSCTYIEEPDAAMITLQQELSLLVDDFVLIKAYRADRLSIHQEVDKKLCPMPFARAHITALGYLNVCCGDFNDVLIIADLNKEHIEDAWKGTRFRGFRRRFLDGNITGTLCGRCFGCLEPVTPIFCPNKEN